MSIKNLYRRDFLKYVFGYFSLGVLTLVASLFTGLVVAKIPPPETFRTFKPKNKRIKEAKWWETICAGVQCKLCPFNCFLPEGQTGICKVRMNWSGSLVTLVYGQPVSVNVDPIEKKPVYHMYPGSRIFSFATAGCNLKCSFCQNWEISQIHPEQARGGEILSPQQIVQGAIQTKSLSIAFTYSEPVVFYEYMLDTAVRAKKIGLKTVVVSAGYINPEPLKEVVQYIDVFKVDLKGFNEKFYRNIVGGELKFVLNTLIELRKLNVFSEIVNLVVPTLNDDFNEIRQMCRWIYKNLGPDVPLFFSRFHPQYKMQNLPPTPVDTLTKAREIAMEEGMNYVYVGNVVGHPGENTYCPKCKNILIRRYGYAILEYNLLRGGYCPYDKTKIPGIWY